MKSFIISFFLALLFCAQAYSSTQISILGAVPKDDSRPIATDLFYQGKVLLASEAIALKKSGVDLSTINPKESDVWKERVLPLTEPQIPFNNGDTIDYLSFVLSRGGNFRFSGIFEIEGVKKVYNILLSKKMHNVLLRSAILKKLGLSVPDMKHLETFKIKFSSLFEKENFLGRLAEDTLGDSGRWVKENGEDYLVLQDALIMEAQQTIYNLALGSIPSGVIQDRRIFNSLLVPFTLTDVPESVNLMSWNGFSIMSNNIRFDYEANEDFTPSFDDVRWIARKLGKLTRQDFLDVAHYAHLPPSVETLVAEKLIARRDVLMALVDLPFTMIPYNAKITQGTELVDGKITKENFEGYASRFSFGDPESPLSGTQIFAFIKKKLLGFTLNSAISQMNDRLMPQTDMAQAIKDKQMQIAQENFNKFLETGKVVSTPLQVWAVPNYSTNILLSRDIITGSYLGTDNLVQLADTIGMSVDLGVFLGTSSLPVPWQASGNLRASLMRNYSHIKPVQDMKIKTPWKNILVPWLMRTQGHIFDDVITSNQKYIEAQDLLDTAKASLSKIDLSMTTPKLVGNLNQILTKLDYPVNLIATLSKTRKIERDTEQLDEDKADYLAQIKNSKNQEVLDSIHRLIENLPNFQNPSFESEKIKRLEILTNYLKAIENLTTEKEKSRQLNNFVEEWITFKKRVATLQSEEESQNKIAFLSESKKSLLALSKKNDRPGIENLIKSLTSHIDLVSKNLGEDRKERINYAFKTIKEELKVGESLVITDSIGASADLSAAYSVAEMLKLSAGINANFLVLSRLHIHRASDDTIQIYKDFGNTQGLALRFSVVSGLPVITLTGKITAGVAKTKFYQLSLDDKDPMEASKVATALKALFTENSLELVQSISKPFELTHHFVEKRGDLSLLVWDWSKLKTNDAIVVKHPEGSVRKFYKILSARRFAYDFKGFFVNVANYILSSNKVDFALQNNRSSDPSMGVLSRGVVRQLSFETESVEGKLSHPMVTLNYAWKGWLMGTKSAQKIISDMNTRFGTMLYMPEALNETTQLQLYSIVCNVYIYEKGLDILAHLPKAKVQELFHEQPSGYYSSFDDIEEQERMGLSPSFMYYQRKYLEAIGKNDVERASRFGEKMISLAEANVSMSDLKLMVGEKNLLITSRVQGFRKGDENGDRPLVSNTWGEIGDQYAGGPLAAIKNFMKMTDSEFFGLWIMGRL